MPFFFNPIWIWKGIKILRTQNVDALHVCDLPMMPLGLILGKLFRLPVIYDMRENYPAAMFEWKERRLFARIFKNPHMAMLLDKYCIRKATKVIVVVENTWWDENSINKTKANRMPTREIHYYIDKNNTIKKRIGMDLIYIESKGKEFWKQ